MLGYSEQLRDLNLLQGHKGGQSRWGILGLERHTERRKKYKLPACGETWVTQATDTKNMQKGHEVQLRYTSTGKCYVDILLMNNAGETLKGNAAK